MKISNVNSEYQIVADENKYLFRASCTAGKRSFALQGEFTNLKPKEAEEKIVDILEKFKDKIKNGEKSSTKIKQSIKNKFSSQLKCLKIKIYSHKFDKKIIKIGEEIAKASKRIDKHAKLYQKMQVKLDKIDKSHQKKMDEIDKLYDKKMAEANSASEKWNLYVEQVDKEKEELKVVGKARKRVYNHYKLYEL